MSERPSKITAWSGIVGWGAARKILERVENDQRRDLFVSLVCHAGVKGAPAMEYMARLLRWHADEADAPAASAKLTKADIVFCERRAKELLTPFVVAGDPRMPKTLRDMREAEAA